jgi:hypothetical protein
VSDGLARAGEAEEQDSARPPRPFVLDPAIPRRAIDGLTRAEEHAPDHGQIDLFAFAERDRLGGALDYSHRISRGVSAFAQGWAGAERDAFDRWRTGFGALGGLRFRF